MKFNLEKALIKANKKLLTPEQLLIVKEYEQHAGLVDDDALLRVGLTANIKEGQMLTQKQKQLKDETRRFKQERVFHISQIEKTCKDYYLRFLPSIRYQGTIDKDLPFKINNFEAAYGVKCQCDNVNQYRHWEFYLRMNPDGTQELVNPNSGTGQVQNTFIMAPASSFKLEQRPKDPLFFYKINEEYYYLIHKWGNDLNIFRRMLGFWSNSFNWYMTFALPSIIAILLSVGSNPSKFDVAMVAVNGFFLIVNSSFYLGYKDDYSPFKNKWNSEYID